MEKPTQSPYLLPYTFFNRPHIRILILLLSFLASLIGLLAPYFQKEFVDNLMGLPSSLPVHMPGADSPILMVLGAFVTMIAAQGLTQLVRWFASRESILLQRDYGEILYRKTLGLRTDTLFGRPVGEVVSLYATDVPGATILIEESVPVGAAIIFPFLLAPFALIYFYDVPPGPTLGLLGLLVFVNSTMAFRQSRFFFNFKQLAAERIALVNEWVQNIRALRILGWTELFEKRIFIKRQEETRNRVQMVTNGQAMNSISTCVTFLINIVVVISLIRASTAPITAGTLLSILWIVGVYLTRPCRQMPWFFTFVFDGLTSTRRLESYLKVTNTQSEIQQISREIAPGKNEALVVHSLNLKIGEKKVLQDISFSVRAGEFVAIVGEVGSGQSLILLSLIGETAATYEAYSIAGKSARMLSNTEIRKHFCFVSQEGFVMSASLRENIAFQYDFHKTRDSEILNSLEAAQFIMQKEGGAEGLDTEIGERGVNLSGGQRQRVSLARADFHSAAILLLDDSLSAVDVDTERSLMKSLFFGKWKNKTRILITHRLSVLPHADRVLFFDNGMLVADGTYDQLFKSNAQFREFTASLVDSKQASKVIETSVSDIVATSVPGESKTETPGGEVIES
ncbi:MAG: ATP-binding cassette domain-containing protein [Pseudobdellovibrionaceae bacterium]